MFTDLKLQSVYFSNKSNIAKEFYEPVLKHAVTFDRYSAYFSSKVLAAYSIGLEYFGMNGHKYRLIVSHEIDAKEFDEIKKGYALKDNLKKQLLLSFEDSLSLLELKNISNLAYFIAKDVVDIKIAFKASGLGHEKFGVAIDSNGNKLSFNGSNNDTYAAMNINTESLNVSCSWKDDDSKFYTKGIESLQNHFDEMWNNKDPDLAVIDVPDIIKRKILQYDKGYLIMEEALIAKNAIIMDFDGQIILRVNDYPIENLINSFFYKMNVAVYEDKVSGDVIYLKPNTSYRDSINIQKKFEQKVPQLLNCSFLKTKRYVDYIKKRQFFIDARARLGIELKTDSSRLADRYLQFKNTVENHMVRRLRNKQMKDAFFMWMMKKSCNFSVPGSGKTSSALAVYSFLKAQGIISKIVMIGPLNSFDSWRDEFKACFGNKEKLNCFDIHENFSDQEKRKIIKYKHNYYNLFLFNYESTKGYLEEISNLVKHGTLLVFDEVHKVKSIEGQRAKCALEIATNANYIIAMTGTPIPNSYLDIYNLLNILYRDDYQDFFGFSLSVLKNPSRQQINEINAKIQPFFCRTTKKELGVPVANDDKIIRIIPTEDKQALFEILRKKYRNNALAFFIRALQLESNPKMLLQKLNLDEFKDILDIPDNYNINGGFDFIDYSEEIKDKISKISQTIKKETCIKLVNTLVRSGKNVIVWCIFTDTIEDFKVQFSRFGISAEIINGSVDLQKRSEVLSDFKNGKFNVLITNPHTLAESVSLHSVCHDAIYFEYSYNLVHLLQSKDRIHRLGLPDNQYTQYYYLCNRYDNGYSLDERVYNRLCQKEKTMIDAIDNQILEPVYTTQEDLENILGSILRIQ